MNLKERLHDYFYNKAYAATGNSFGRFMLGVSAPVLRRAFPVESNTQSPTSILESLGYNPYLFEGASDLPVRVFTRDLGGMLALSTMVSDQILVRDAFAPRNDAVAFMTSRRSNANAHYLVLNDRRDYQTTIAEMSGLNEKDMAPLKGDEDLSLALSMGHEISHFDLPYAEADQAALDVFVESNCDVMPLNAFNNACDPETFQATFQDLISARAVRPILDALKDKGEVKNSKFGHATALALDNPGLLRLEDIGEQIINAYQEARLILKEYLDWGSFHSRELESYKAALSALQDEDFSNPLAKRAIELFAEGMEHLAPSLVAQAKLDVRSENYVDRVL